MPTASKTKRQSEAHPGFKPKRRPTADKLRNNMDAAEYKHVVHGLIFLKYISGAFEEHRVKLVEGLGEYAGANREVKTPAIAKPPLTTYSKLVTKALFAYNLPKLKRDPGAML